MNNDVFTLDDNNNAAIRTIGVKGIAESNSPSVFTEDENGNAAIRVTGGGGDAHNKGYFATQEALEEAYATAEPGDYAIVGSTDTVWVWDEDSSAWVDTDTKGQVESVNNMTGQVVLTGADLTTLVEVATATLTQELANDTIYDCGEMTSVTLTLPATMDAKFISQLNFTSGATPTSITAPNTVKWLGNDIAGGVFVPVASKRYCVLFFYDGTAVRGLVQGA